MMKALSKVIHFLFSRRLQKWRSLFIVAALPLIYFSIWGWEYGVSLFYVIPATISIAQFFYPTMVAWIIVSFLYFIWAVSYILAVLLDLYKKVRGMPNSALFVDVNDTIFFLALTLFVTLLCLGLLIAKPKIKER
jgi:hypothetical protein